MNYTMIHMYLVCRYNALPVCKTYISVILQITRKKIFMYVFLYFVMSELLLKEIISRLVYTFGTALLILNERDEYVILFQVML